MSEETVAAAVIAALTALEAVPYDLDDAKRLKNLPSAYNEVMVGRRFAGAARLGAGYGTTSYRLAIRAVGSTVTNAREMRQRAGLIEDTVLTVDGVDSTPVQFESAEPIGEDDQWWTGLSTYTFTL